MLELGCGNGMSSSLLMARKGYEVHGVDISKAAIAWAREQFTDYALCGTFGQGDVCDMPFLTEHSFDIVIDGSCLHCLIGNDRDPVPSGGSAHSSARRRFRRQQHVRVAEVR